MHSELNFPIGEKGDLDFGLESSGHRWELPLYLWQGILGCSTQTLPLWLKGNDFARDTLSELAAAMQRGFTSGGLQRRPHVVLLDPQNFYRNELLTPLIDWTLLWLKNERLGQAEGVPTRLIRKALEVGPFMDAKLGTEDLAALNELTPQGWKMLNLATDWLHTFLPHCFQKVPSNSVTCTRKARARARLCVLSTLVSAIRGMRRWIV